MTCGSRPQVVERCRNRSSFASSGASEPSGAVWTATKPVSPGTELTRTRRSDALRVLGCEELRHQPALDAPNSATLSSPAAASTASMSPVRCSRSAPRRSGRTGRCPACRRPSPAGGSRGAPGTGGSTRAPVELDVRHEGRTMSTSGPLPYCWNAMRTPWRQRTGPQARPPDESDTASRPRLPPMKAPRHHRRPRCRRAARHRSARAADRDAARPAGADGVGVLGAARSSRSGSAARSTPPRSPRCLPRSRGDLQGTAGHPPLPGLDGQARAALASTSSTSTAVTPRRSGRDVETGHELFARLKALPGLRRREGEDLHRAAGQALRRDPTRLGGPGRAVLRLDPPLGRRRRLGRIAAQGP